MTTKKSISICDTAATSITKRKTCKRGQYQPIWSPIISQIINNYEHLLKRNTPTLKTTEWKLLSEVYKKNINLKLSLPICIKQDILEHFNQDRPENVNNPIATSLIKKTQCFSQLEQLACVDTILIHFSKSEHNQNS